VQLSRRKVFAALVAPLLARFLPKKKPKVPTGGLFNPHANLAKLYRPGMIWAGDKFDNGETAETVLAAYAGAGATIEELRFYDGAQWEPEILTSRMAAARPTLVLNRLPALVTCLVSRSKLQGATLDLSQQSRLVAAIVKRNADAQRMHNWFASVDLEREIAEHQVFMSRKNFDNLFPGRRTA
jgi:hypothetical protein